MSRMLATKKQIEQIISQEIKTKTKKQNEQLALGKSISIGATIGAFIGYLVTLTSKEEKPASDKLIPLAGFAIGAAIGAKWQEKVEKTAVLEKADLQSEIKEAKQKVRKNTQSAAASYENIFGSYVDDFVVEHSLYNASYEQKTIESKVAELKFEIDKIVTSSTKASIEAIEKQLFDKTETSEEDAPRIAFERKELATKLQALKDILSAESEKKSNLKTELKGILKAQADAETTISRIQRGYPNVMANREARGHFVELFIDPFVAMKEDLAYIEGLSNSEDGKDILFAKALLAELKGYIIFIEDHFKEYSEDIKLHVSNQFSKNHKIKEAREDMTYMSAPFWKTWHTYSNPSYFRESGKAQKALDEIIAGVEEDIEKGREKGSWLAIRNFSGTWLFELGEFSEDDAAMLSSILKGYIADPVTPDTEIQVVNDAYRRFVKECHSDVNDGEEHELMKKGAEYVKKFRAYAENRDQILKG